MALTPERKAQMDAALQQAGIAPMQQTGQISGLSPERKAQMDAVLQNSGLMPSQQPMQAQPAPEQKQQGVGGLGGFVVGAEKGLVSTLTGASSLGEKMLTGITKAVLPKSLEAKLGIDKPLKKTGAETLIPEKFRKPEGLAEKAGFLTEQVGEFFVPGGAITKGAKVLEGALQASKFAPKFLPAFKLGIRAAGTALEGGGITAIQTGGDLEETKKATELGAAIPVAGALLRNLGRGVGKVGGEVFGKTTGVGADVIFDAYNNPAVKNIARQAGKTGGASEILSSTLDDAKKALDRTTSLNSKLYREAMNKIKTSTKDLTLAVDDIRGFVVKTAKDDFAINFGPGKKLNNLDFSRSDLVEGTASVQRAFDKLFAQPIKTVEQLDRVKKSLGSLAKGAPNGSPAQAFIYQMRSAVSEALKKNIPGYEKEMARFSNAKSLSDEIEKVLSLSDKASRDTAIRKLVSTTRQNFEYRKALLDALSEKSGIDFSSRLSGAMLAPITPRGLSGVSLGPTGLTGGILASLNPATIPMYLLYIASTSPRLVAEFVSILGRIKGKVITPKIKQALEAVLFQAIREQEKPVTDISD